MDHFTATPLWNLALDGGRNWKQTGIFKTLLKRLNVIATDPSRAETVFQRPFKVLSVHKNKKITPTKIFSYL